MRRWVVGVVIAASLALPLVAGAQSAPNPHATMQKVFLRAKTDAFAALTPDHRARVGAIFAQLNSGSIDRRTATQQIDALLTPAEKSAVVAVQQKAFADLRAALGRPPNPNAGAGGSGGPPGGGPPGGAQRRAPDPGRFLVLLSRPQRRGAPPDQRSPNAP